MVQRRGADADLARQGVVHLRDVVVQVVIQGPVQQKAAAAAGESADPGAGMGRAQQTRQAHVPAHLVDRLGLHGPQLPIEVSHAGAGATDQGRDVDRQHLVDKGAGLKPGHRRGIDRQHDAAAPLVLEQLEHWQGHQYVAEP